MTVEADELKSYLRSHFGNHADEVLDVLRGWEAFGDLFTAWRDAWTDDTEAYQLQRAMRFPYAVSHSRSLSTVTCGALRQPLSSRAALALNGLAVLPSAGVGP
eukprot:6187544-Pleurochrysis_carterae.AAC.2